METVEVGKAFGWCSVNTGRYVKGCVFLLGVCSLGGDPSCQAPTEQNAALNTILTPTLISAILQMGKLRLREINLQPRGQPGILSNTLSQNKNQGRTQVCGLAAEQLPSTGEVLGSVPAPLTKKHVVPSSLTWG